jgi:hypothetical protein
MAKGQVWFKGQAVSLFSDAARQISGALVRYADGEGNIPTQYQDDVARDAGRVIGRLFVGDDGRTAVRRDGTPLSPFARVLLQSVAMVTQLEVMAQRDYMLKVVPDDLRGWLSGGRRVDISELTPSPKSTPHPSPLPVHREGELIASVVAEQLTEEEIEALRLFRPDPNAEVDPTRGWVPAHRWTDPNGYRLSDRLWRTDNETRQRIDAALMDALRNGRGALETARILERFLIPGRAQLRTRRPYGVDASYAAMRLARTEIARAANQAAFISAYLNPYVGGIDVARSRNGDARCPICPRHATIGFGGERLRPPYPVTGAFIGPYHPHCMCHVRPVVTDTPETVTARLREMMDESRARNLDPYMTPLAGDTFIRMLLGDSVWGLLRQIAPVQPGLF